MEKRDNQKIAILVLLFLLIISVGYIAFDKIREYKQFTVDDEAVVLDMKIKKV